MKCPALFWTVALAAWPLVAHADPLTTMDQVGQQVLSCWAPPAGMTKSAVRMSFSFKQDGTLIGPPEPTFIDVNGDEAVRDAFIAAAADAIERCTPVEFSADLAAGIGGQVFTLEFATGDRAHAIAPDN
jgi:hypothetical protein